jgi:hypothetical protein
MTLSSTLQIEHSLLLMLWVSVIYVSVREIYYLLYYIKKGRWLNGSVFHSIAHIIILTMIPIISAHTIYYSESNKAIFTLLSFMWLIVWHMADERKDYFINR